MSDSPLHRGMNYRCEFYVSLLRGRAHLSGWQLSLPGSFIRLDYLFYKVWGKYLLEKAEKQMFQAFVAPWGAVRVDTLIQRSGPPAFPRWTLEWGNPNHPEANDSPFPVRDLSQKQQTDQLTQAKNQGSSGSQDPGQTTSLLSL